MVGHVDLASRTGGLPAPHGRRTVAPTGASPRSATLDEWLAPYLPGATRRADLERVDLAMVLRSQLPWPVGAELDEVAPVSLTLATGRSVPDRLHGRGAGGTGPRPGPVRHDGAPHGGWTPDVLHLLSPADRPIQITADLPGFWAGSWSEVRKDLAGRYPKHQWPADPATATPSV